VIVAITGGAGFIGRRLVAHHLEAGDEVRVLTRRFGQEFPEGVSCFYGDLINPNTEYGSFLQGVDVFYHCAGEIRDESRMRQLHVEGTRRLISAFRGQQSRWVQLSSVGAYGSRAEGLVIESDLSRPYGEYERTKAEADELVLEAGRGGMNFVILRPSNVFGAGMPNQSLLQMARMVRKGLFFFIGRPGASANYVPVENVVEALVLCGQSHRARGRTYIVSDWRELESLIETMSRLMDCPVPTLRLPEAFARAIARASIWLPRFPLTPSRVSALTVRSRYSTEKLEKELGYVPRISIEKGLENLLAACDLLAKKQG